MQDRPTRPRWASIFRRSPRSEVEDELSYHLEQRVRDYIARGMDPEAARSAARERLGDLDHVRRECTDMLTSERRTEGRRRWLSVSWLDFKLGFRMLARYPGLTLVGGLAIAFAVAVSAGTFELTTQVMNPTLPLPDGDRIVAMRLWDVQESDPESRALYDLGVWRQELESVEQLGAYRTIERNLITGDGQGEPVDLAAISAAAFRVTRVPPLLGRTLIPSDELPGAADVVVIGYDVWQARFAGAPDIVGREVRLGKTVHTVVGVMPDGFAFPVNHSLWVPLRVNPLRYGRREGPGIVVFGRLAPGATLEEAQAELTTLGRRLAVEFPDTHEHLRPQVMAYTSLFVDPTDNEAKAAALFTNGFVVMFLVLICANVATLVFARTATRESELIVRSALGASRGRIVTQLFAETFVLGAAGAIVGLAVAALMLRWALDVLTAVQGDLPFWIEAGLSPTTVLYAGLLAVLVAVVAGVMPAFKVTGRALQARLGQAGIGGSSLRFGKLWTGVIVAQVAFTVAFLPLLVGTGSDIDDIESPDFGLPADEYLSVRLEMDREATLPSGDAASAEAEHNARFRSTYDELARRLAAEPGVTGVTHASQLPGGYHERRLIEAEGVPIPLGHVQERQVQPVAVGVGFFDAFEAPIVAGRGFRDTDLGSDARVVIVNPSFVDQFLGGRNPIGRRVRFLCAERGCDTPGEEPGPWHEIVGVASELSLTIDPDLPHNAGLYHPVRPGEDGAVRVAVHVRGDPEAFIPRLRALAFEIDPTLRLYDLRPLDEIRWDLLVTYLFWLKIGVLAGCVVLILSTVGIYSVMSFTVSRRTREIGIRLALGAGRRRIVTSIVSRAAAQLGLGVLVGAGLLMTMALQAGDGQMSLRGFMLIGAGVAIMLTAGMLACVMPVRRALSIQPTEALRADA